MSTAVPERRNVPQLSDEQVMKLDWWYPHTTVRIVTYVVWLYFFAVGAVMTIEMLFSLLRDGLNYWTFVVPAICGALGMFFSRRSRREKINDRYAKRALKAEREGQQAEVQEFPQRPSILSVVGFAVSVGFALFGFLNLLSHFGLFNVNGFNFTMCFIQAALLAWFLYLTPDGRRKNAQCEFLKCGENFA